MNSTEILSELSSLANPESVKGMARFRIKPQSAYGVSIPDLRRLAKQIGKRNRALNQAAIDVSKAIQTIDSRAARWIAGNALRELTGEQVQSIFLEKNSTFV